MKLLRNKITILILIATLVSIGVIVFIHLYFSSSVEKLKRNYAQSQVSLLQNHIIINSAPARKALIYLSGNVDVESCELLQSGFPEGIGDRLSMAGLSFVVATNSKLTPVAIFPSNQKDIRTMIPGSIQIFSKILSDGKITQYYQIKNDSVFELLALKIPGCQKQLSDSSEMWLFAGRYINEELTGTIVTQLPGKIAFHYPPEKLGSAINAKNNLFSSSLPLYGWDNLPVVSISIETQPELMQLLSRQQKSLLFVLIGMATAFMIFIYLYLNRYYLLPIRMLSLALKEKDPEYIRIISDTDPDFSSLQLMLINVFNQEKLLSDIVKRRSRESSNNYHAAILSRINDAVYTTDHKGIITYWNAAAEDLYLIPEENAVSKIAHLLIKNKWKNPEQEKQQAISLETTGVWQGLIAQELPDGSEIFVDVSLSCLYDNDDKLLGHLSIARKPSH